MDITLMHSYEVHLSPRTTHSTQFSSCSGYYSSHYSPRNPGMYYELEATSFRRRQQRFITRHWRYTSPMCIGAALAGIVWFFVIVGGNYAASMAPDPVDTSMVRVCGGETLNSFAARVAPDIPRKAVINQIRALNGLSSSHLPADKILLAPVYE